MRTLLAVLLAASALVGRAEAAAPPPLALFDAHSHMMIELITPEDEVARLRKAGLSRVLMMHTEPQVIAALARRHPDFLVPSLSVARTNVQGVHLDAATGPLMSRAYGGGDICSFGEIPGLVFADSSDFDAIYTAAATRGAPLNLHLDLANPQVLASLEKALSANPKTKVVLAHLGWTAGPELIGRLLDAHPNLWTDVSIRFDPPGSIPWRNNGLDLSILAADGQIQPDWRALMERKPDRFLFAMDVNSFGPRYTMIEDLVAAARKALAPLPRPAQEAIAHGNIERLLGACAG